MNVASFVGDRKNSKSSHVGGIDLDQRPEVTENCRFSEKAGFWQLARDTDVLKIYLELFGVAAFGYDPEKSARPRSSGQTGNYRFSGTITNKVIIRGSK